jgi:amidase
MPEFGAAIETDNLIYGRTSNPYDLDRFAGGSSGGEAAIIAAGGSPLGVGGDSGGSIREPAHYCGIAGLKPTTGRIPRTGFLLPSSGALSFKQQNGPMARSVEDLFLGLRILAGEDGRDPSVVPVPLRDPGDVDVRALRIAYYTDNGIVSCSPEITAMVHRAADALREAGAARVEEAPPPNVEGTLDLYMRLSAAPGATAARAGLQALGTNEASDFYRHMMPLLEKYDGMKASELLHLTEEWDRFKADMLAYMGDWDVILSPTTSIPAMPHKSSLTNPTILQSFTYCAIYNLTGYPAATVRGGTSPEGLPIGVQIAARPWREDIVLAVAAALEQALGGYVKPDWL